MPRYIHINTEKAAATRAAVQSDVTSTAGGILAYLGWVQLWLSCLTENINQNINRGFAFLRAFEAKALRDAADIASGKTRAPALIPESERVAEAPKILLNRRAKRILARGLPASRQYGWFRFASPRTLSGTQFFELVAKLSVNGRMGVYGLEYKTRLCCRPILNAVFGDGPSLRKQEHVNLGFCAAHLWPN